MPFNFEFSSVPNAPVLKFQCFDNMINIYVRPGTGTDASQRTTLYQHIIDFRKYLYQLPAHRGRYIAMPDTGSKETHGRLHHTGLFEIEPWLSNHIHISHAMDINYKIVEDFFNQFLIYQTTKHDEKGNFPLPVSKKEVDELLLAYKSYLDGARPHDKDELKEAKSEVKFFDAKGPNKLDDDKLDDNLSSIIGIMKTVLKAIPNQRPTDDNWRQLFNIFKSLIKNAENLDQRKNIVNDNKEFIDKLDAGNKNLFSSVLIAFVKFDPSDLKRLNAFTRFFQNHAFINNIMRQCQENQPITPNDIIHIMQQIENHVLKGHR